MGRFTFLFIDLIIIGLPVLFSFSKHLHFISRLKHVVVATLVVSTIYIPWNIAFTTLKIWSYNPLKHLGTNLAKMPMEAYLYFTFTPYLCIFIYVWLTKLIKKNYFKGAHFALTPFLIAGMVLLLINNFDQTYAAISMCFLILLLLIQLVNGKRYMGKFYLSFVFSIIPLFLVDTLLAASKVIIYNPKVTLSYKLGYLPIDNLIFDAGLCLFSVMGYEWSQRKFFKHQLNQTELEDDSKSA